MDTRLSGKVAVVTGAGRVGGIGEAIARALAAEGAKVVLSDIGRPFERFPDYQVAARSEIDTIRAEARPRSFSPTSRRRTTSRRS